jgi:hypothetical protein
LVNVGISGSTAVFWRKRFDGSSAPTEGTDYFVWVGVNDIVSRGRTPEATANDIVAITRRLSARSGRVLIVEQPQLRPGSNLRQRLSSI